MTKQEAKEIMSKVTFYWELGEQTLTQNQINEALEMAIKALEQRLIPVSERLPEIKRDVLVYLKNGRFFVAALFADPFPDATGQCYRWIGEEEISFPFCDVVAWLALPETYQEIEEK